MRKVLAILLSFIGYGISIILMISGLLVSFSFVAQEYGFFVFNICLLFFPLTFIFAPFYIGLAYGYWLPLILNYGWIFGMPIILLAKFIEPPKTV